jgi:hypothetical protein
MLKCPKDKLINPKTGNCVKRDGRVGKLLLAARKSSQKCPKDKVINPKTGNCVKRDGRVGKSILGSSKKSVKKTTKNRNLNKCPDGKIINPDTGNCVKKDGRVGKLILGSPKKKPTVKKSTEKVGCKKQTTAKYHKKTRKSPPYPANQCHGMSLYGNDGNMYVSVSNVNGIYTWRLKK